MAATGNHAILYTPGNLTTLPIFIDEWWCAAAIAGIVTVPINTEPAGVTAVVSVFATPVDQNGVPVPGEIPFTIGAVSGWALRGDATPQRVRLGGSTMLFPTRHPFYRFTLILQSPAGSILGPDDFFVVSIVELDGPGAMFGGGGAPPTPTMGPGPDTTDSIGPQR